MYREITGPVSAEIAISPDGDTLSVSVCGFIVLRVSRIETLRLQDARVEGDSG